MITHFESLIFHELITIDITFLSNELSNESEFCLLNKIES